MSGVPVWCGDFSCTCALKVKVSTENDSEPLGLIFLYLYFIPTGEPCQTKIGYFILFYLSLILSREKANSGVRKHWNITPINSTLRLKRNFNSKQLCWLRNVPLLSKGLSKWLRFGAKNKNKRSIALLCDYVTRYRYFQVSVV